MISPKFSLKCLSLFSLLFQISINVNSQNQDSTTQKNDTIATINEINSENLIWIEEFDTTLVGKKMIEHYYHGVVYDYHGTVEKLTLRIGVNEVVFDGTNKAIPDYRLGLIKLYMDKYSNSSKAFKNYRTINNIEQYSKLILLTSIFGIFISKDKDSKIYFGGSASLSFVTGILCNASRKSRFTRMIEKYNSNL